MNARDNRSITSTRLKSRVGRIHKSLTSYGTILFVLFIAFSSTGLYFLKNTTMSNTRATITEMSTRVGTKAIAALDHQQQFLETAAHYLADKQQDAKLTGRNIDYLTWLKDCYSLLSRNFGTAHFELHVYVDGVLYTTASRAQGGILPFDGRDALWYQRALQNHGRTVLIDPYTDLFTGTRIITLAARVGNTQNVLACDLFPELSRITELDNLLPKGFSFYLTDSHGYIAAYTAQGTSYREAQETVNTYFLPLFNDPETFAARSIVFVDAVEEDLLAVLIRDPVTGWFTVLTTSYENMLRGYYAVEELFIFMIVAFLVIGLGMLIREHHLSRQIEVNHETLKVLGNSYQTIVRINFNRGTYTLLKGSDLLRERLKKLPESKRHKYSSLMQVICSIISPEFRESFEENYGLSSVAHFAINRVRDVGHDYRFETAEGTHLWYNVRILFDESLDLEESVLSFKLVDDEKLQELTEQSLLRDALESARRSESSKNAFFASVSHDMRTPLNGIIGLCTLVFAHKESELKIPDLLASFRKIDSSSRQLLQLVDDVLEVSRPTETRAPARERFNLHTSLNEVLEIFRVQALNEHKHFEVSENIRHPNVIGDFPVLRQIINNLLSNAFKYSQKEATISFKIREMVELKGANNFSIEISDTGIGMSEEFMQHLFTPYLREGKLKHVSGTGLGLVIVRNLVTRLNGDLRVTSKEGAGTTFTVILPLEIAEEESCPVPTLSSLQEARAQEPSVPASPAELKGLRVLLAEDNELNMEIATDMLNLRGVEVIPAVNGEEALRIFKERGEGYFDAVLLDMRMPVMDGCETALAIRALQGYYARKVPIIAVTANAFADDIAATQAAGMDAHVSKPIDFRILEKVLSALTRDFRAGEGPGFSVRHSRP